MLVFTNTDSLRFHSAPSARVVCIGHERAASHAHFELTSHDMLISLKRRESVLLVPEGKGQFRVCVLTLSTLF